MAKIIHFPDNRDEYASVAEFLQETIQIMEDEGAISCLVAAKTESGLVVTGYHNCDFGARQELNGHIQCDIIDQMVRNNPDRY